MTTSSPLGLHRRSEVEPAPLQSKMSLLPRSVLFLLVVAAFATFPSLADEHGGPHHDGGNEDHKPPHFDKPPQEHDHHEPPKKNPPTEEPPHHGPHPKEALDSHPLKEQPTGGKKPPQKHKGPPNHPGQTLLEDDQELAGMPRKVNPSSSPFKKTSPPEKKQHPRPGPSHKPKPPVHHE